MIKTLFWALAMSVSTLASAGVDPDEYRKVDDGVVAFAQERVEVGGTYAGFLIAFPDRSDVYLSPSRYRVSYLANALECRNVDQFPMDSIRDGRWWQVTFEVLAVKESAIEDPPKSGNWAWRHSYDCIIKNLEHAG